MDSVGRDSTIGYYRTLLESMILDIIIAYFVIHFVHNAECAINYWASHNPSGSLLTQVFSEKVFALELGTN
ncbi:MAG: hypothetical protein WBM37_04140, partial [Nitrososphaeraceae archaeon]